MKIAVWHNLPSGGGKRALYYFVRGLVGRGHQLACWSLDTADHSYLPLSEFAPEQIISSELNGRARKSFTDKWRPDVKKAVDRMRAFDQACRRCAHEIEAGDFDVLFANSALHYYVPYIMRHLRMKKILYLQEPCRYLYEASPILPWVSNAPEELEQADLFSPRRFIADYPLLQTLRLQAKQEWLNIESCDQVLVNSYFSRESVLRSYGVDARVCYLGVDTTLFRDLGLPRERIIVGLGSFDSIKGVDLAVKAVALLPDPRPPLVWVANFYMSLYGRLRLEIREERAEAEKDESLARAAARREALEEGQRRVPAPHRPRSGLSPARANAPGVSWPAAISPSHHLSSVSSSPRRSGAIVRAPVP